MLLDLEPIDAGALDVDNLTTTDLALTVWDAEWGHVQKSYQAEPPGDWSVWAIIAGRGAGKTRAGAENLGRFAWRHDKTRWLVTGPTTDDVRSVCIEGESGLMNVLPPEIVQDYNKTLFEIRLTNGSLIKGISAEEPSRFRGPQFHGGWADEVAAWRRIQATWDMMMFGMRLGQMPKIIVTTTPQPKPLIKQLVMRTLSVPTVLTRATTYDNLDNLAPTFRQTILQYEGTELGRQEINAELVEGGGGVIRRDWWRVWPDDRPLPVFSHIVMSIDTAFTERTRNRDRKSTDFGKADPSACSVWGLFEHEATKKAGIMLLDCWTDYLGFPDLVDRVKKEADIKYGADARRPLIKPQFGPPLPRGEEGYPVDQIVIEDKGSGISLRQMLAQEKIFTWPFNPGNADKLARLHAVSHVFAGGVIWVPESESVPRLPKTWAEPLISQVCSFRGEGTTEHDDLVDTTSQGLRYLIDYARISVTKEDEDEEYLEPEEVETGNPYMR